MDVSRETAARAFGERLPLAEAYARLLATHGVERGLIGPRETGRLWQRHLLNSAALAEVCPRDGLLVDVGSGAGLPGLPVAIARPGLTVRLVEPLLRRSAFLAEVVARLGLDNVEVVRARAEELHGAWTAPLVTARAVAALDRVAAWCLPLIEPGGSLLAVKGRRAEAEITEAESTLHRLGAADWSIEEVGAGLVDPPVRLVRVVAGAPVIRGGPRPRPGR